MSRFANKVVVITGGNSGMGLVTAKRFVEEGAQVVITGRRQAELDEAARFLERNVTTVQGDVSKLEDLDRLYAVVKEKFGRIDVLFANAGLGQLAPLGAVEEAHFDREFGVNVKGLFFTVQKALPLLKDGSSVILNASVAASKGMSAFSVYSATKAAVRSFARSWTTDLKDRKIRVNAISPGPIETPIFDKMGLDDDGKKQFETHVKASVPLARFGKPEEIASAVLFLASDESSYITGVELNVDGGLGQV